MPESRPDPDPDDLAKQSHESLERAHEMVEELKMIEEHEKKVIEGGKDQQSADQSCSARI